MSVLFPLRRGRSLRHWAMLCLIACFVAAPAWSASALSFEDTVRLAVERAPTLDARRLQGVAAREEAARASALPDPQLTVGIDNLTLTGSDAFDFRADDMTMKRIGLMQEFPARAKRQARQAVADRNIEQAEALSTAERLSVRKAAAEAWIALWAAEREVKTLNSLRDQSKLAIRLSKAQLANGTGTAVDTLATQAAALDLDNRIDEAQAAVEAARSSLARWLGVDPAELTTVGEPPDLMILPVNEAGLLTSVDEQGPLLPWRSTEAKSEAEVALALAEKRPDWSIGASYGQRDRTPAGVPRSDMLTVEFAIGLPLSSVNRQDRGVAARRAELDAVAASHEDARRAQIEAVRRTLAEWNGLKRQIARKEQEMLPLARDRSQTAIASYGGGGPLQPWLEARRDELELHIEHARHLGELGRAWAALAYLLPTAEDLS
mgnify:CR=1 FL=1